MTKKQKKQAYAVWIVDNLENIQRSILNLQNNLANNDFGVAQAESNRISALLENVVRTKRQMDLL